MKTWIVADAEHLGGWPRVRDTRVSVAQLLEGLAAGLSVTEIVDAYPSLTDESVRGVRLNWPRPRRRARLEVAPLPK